jgi:hypothetical protein
VAINLDLRERAIVDGIRMDALEQRMDELREPPFIGIWPTFELRRLQALVARQAAEIARLQAELRAAQEAARLVQLENLTEAVLGAFERGSATLLELEVVEATAELKVVFEIHGGAPGFVVGAVGPIDPRVLSTVRFDLRRRPPSAV